MSRSNFNFDKLKTKNEREVGIVIVTFNNEKEIEDLLLSLSFQSAWEHFVLDKILIIDNNSSDKTVSKILFLKKSLGSIRRKIKVIRNSENYGFAKGVNQGISLLNSGIIILINPDVKLQKDTLRELIRCLHFADIVGGKLIKTKKQSVATSQDIHGTFVRKPTFWTGVFEFTNIKKLWGNNPFYRKFYYLDEKNPYRPRYVDAVSGALMAFRRKVQKALDGFDENFFLYLEDVDFCIRAKKRGLKVFFCPKASAWHYGGASSKNQKGNIRYDAWVFSRRYFFKKHLSAFLFFLLNLLFYLDELIVQMKNVIFQ